MVSGRNWSVHNGVFTIFDKSGFVSGNSWVLPVDSKGDVLDESSPKPIKVDIERIIATDIRDGKGDGIAYVGVGAYEGLLLALEGVITVRMLRASSETPDRIIVEVTLRGARRTLVILRDDEYPMATFDKNDRII